MRLFCYFAFFRTKNLANPNKRSNFAHAIGSVQLLRKGNCQSQKDSQ
jgi:hypothetical protein